jgi:hypothetical protein
MALTVVGGAALLNGLWTFGKPLGEDAPERTGWLFQHFGPRGPALGTIIMGLFFALLGFWGARRRFAEIQAARARLLKNRS